MTTSQHPHQRPRPDPLAMTPAEKVVAEWEARHDVAARGHHAALGVVQQYLAESRTRAARDSGATAGTRRPDPPRQASSGPAGGPEPVPAPSRHRRWWLFGRRG